MTVFDHLLQWSARYRRWRGGIWVYVQSCIGDDGVHALREK